MNLSHPCTIRFVPQHWRWQLHPLTAKVGAAHFLLGHMTSGLPSTRHTGRVSGLSLTMGRDALLLTVYEWARAMSIPVPAWIWSMLY